MSWTSADPGQSSRPRCRFLEASRLERPVQLACSRLERRFRVEPRVTFPPAELCCRQRRRRRAACGRRGLGCGAQLSASPGTGGVFGAPSPGRRAGAGPGGRAAGAWPPCAALLVGRGEDGPARATLGAGTSRPRDPGPWTAARPWHVRRSLEAAWPRLAGLAPAEAGCARRRVCPRVSPSPFCGSNACLPGGARQQVPGVCAARQLSSSSQRRSEALAGAPLDNAPKEYPPKIQQLVQDIASLTLLEISDLNELLKKTLKIQDVGLMPMGGMMPGAVPAAAAAAPEVAEGEDIPKQKERTHFTVRLTEAKPVDKVKLIKEIKNYVQGINLVQAKKLVESLPQEIKANVAKAEAEKIKAALEAVGGTVVLE
ncbi:mitochondrial ribosomal protein L12 [Cricetulus griseus]